jgi:hypothetical protein
VQKSSQGQSAGPFSPVAFRRPAFLCRFSGTENKKAGLPSTLVWQPGCLEIKTRGFPAPPRDECGFVLATLLDRAPAPRPQLNRTAVFFRPFEGETDFNVAFLQPS